MCSVADNDDESRQCMEEKTLQILFGALCRKCQVNKAEVVLRVKDTYCRHCFSDSFTHKFRAALGKSRILKTNDKVLVLISGSLPSMALLQLVKDGIEITSPKRLQCIPNVLFIDEGAVLGQSSEERQTICNSIGKIVNKYNIPGHITSLNRSLCTSGNKSESKLCYSLHENTQLVVDEEGDVQLNRLFAQLKSLSSKEDLLLKLRHKLMFSVAQELDCSKIFVGDCATDLAISIMANLSLGRGAQLPYDVGFCDSRYDQIKLLRPMRDFSKKEIAFYSVFKNIESVHYTSLSTKADQFSSIQKLTEKFITELQNDFPATVSTIFRTGDKLTSEGAGNIQGETCILCQASVDTSKQTSSSLQATEFSQLISSARFRNVNSLMNGDLDTEILQSDTPHTTNAANGCCSDDDPCTCAPLSETHKLDFHQIKEWLCYGCRLIVKEMDSLDALPCDIINFIKTELSQKRLRKEIQGFLL